MMLNPTANNEGVTIVSIVIPLYNGKKHICETVRNVLKLHGPKEIIIVDDGSKDGGFDYCLQVFADEKDVRIIHKKNGGIASARNYGLEHSSGKYVLFVDQDDTIVADTINSAIRLLEENNDLDFVCWSTESVYSDQRHESLGRNCITTHINRNEIIEDLLPKLLYRKDSKYSTYIGSVWAMLFRNSLIRKYRLHFRSFVCYEDDYLFVLDYLSRAVAGAMVKDIGYYWTVNEESYSHQKRYIDNLFDKTEALNRYRLECIKQIGLPQSIVEEFTAFTRQELVIWLISNGFERWSISISDVFQVRSVLKRKEYKEAFQTEKMVSGRYNQIMYELLRHNLAGCAMAATRLVFIKATIQNKIMDMAHQNAK